MPSRPIKVTHVEPFNLETEKRGTAVSKRLQEKLAAEEKKLHDQANFVANPVPVTRAFIPAKSNKPSTECDEVVLHSELRAIERRHFEDENARREQEKVSLKEIADKQKDEKEKRELKALRDNLTITAQPIRHFSGVVVGHSSKKLTEPKSPMIGEKRKRAGLQSSKLAN